MKFLMAMAVIRFVFALLDQKKEKNEVVSGFKADVKHPAEFWIR